MTTPGIKITQVKLDIRQIIENLNRLENGLMSHNNLHEIKCDTEKLISDLESMPLQGLKRKLMKQHRKRHMKKIKKGKIQEQNNIKINTNLQVVATCSKTFSDSSKNTTTISKPHHQLKSLQECQRFLKTFELLEQLHLARSQNPSNTRKFTAKLQQLKYIWNCLLQEQEEQTSKNLKTQQLWDEVLFGPPEKMYFQETPNLKDFVTKRQIWDSYIDNKHGSSIPTGWILPPLEANEKWCQYLGSSG